MPSFSRWQFCTVLLLGLASLKSVTAQDQPVKVDVHWDKVVRDFPDHADATGSGQSALTAGNTCS